MPRNHTHRWYRRFNRNEWDTAIARSHDVAVLGKDVYPGSPAGTVKNAIPVTVLYLCPHRYSTVVGRQDISVTAPRDHRFCHKEARKMAKWAGVPEGARERMRERNKAQPDWDWTKASPDPSPEPPVRAPAGPEMVDLVEELREMEKRPKDQRTTAYASNGAEAVVQAHIQAVATASAHPKTKASTRSKRRQSGQSRVRDLVADTRGGNKKRRVRKTTKRKRAQKGRATTPVRNSSGADSLLPELAAIREGLSTLTQALVKGLSTLNETVEAQTALCTSLILSVEGTTEATKNIMSLLQDKLAVFDSAGY